MHSPQIRFKKSLFAHPRDLLPALFTVRGQVLAVAILAVEVSYREKNRNLFVISHIFLKKIPTLFLDEADLLQRGAAPLPGAGKVRRAPSLAQRRDEGAPGGKYYFDKLLFGKRISALAHSWPRLMRWQTWQLSFSESWRSPPP